MTWKEGYDQANSEDTIFQEQTRLLFHNSRTAAVVNICIAFLTYLAIPSQRYDWLWSITGVAVLRLLFHSFYTNNNSRGYSLKTLYFITLFLVAMQGATWGFSSVLLYNSATNFYRFYLIVILCGMTVGSVLVLTPSMSAFACFSIPAVVPIVFFLLMEDTSLRHVGYMGMVFLVAVHILAKRISVSNLELLRSRKSLENTSRELARHKNHLEILVEERTKELAESRENYRQLTEEINDAIFELDSEGRMTYVSPAITAIIGYHPDQLTGRHFSEVVFGEDLALLQERFQQVLSGILQPAEFRIVDLAGNPHWIRTSSRPILRNDGPAGIRGILTDIANEKREMAEKTKLLQRIHDNQKLEAIGTLAGGIAHDFNNILSVIVGFCEITKMNNAENRLLSDNMDKVLKASERARGLVRQILTFSKQSKQERKLVEPHLLLREGIELLSGSIPKTIKITENISTDSAPILADPAEFNQIIVNLCTNAYYAMKDKGGILEISLDAVAVDSETAHSLAVLQEGPYVRLRVRDTGHGIPEENLPRIFEPFYTTKPIGEGTGLGLSVIHGLIQSLQGAITVDSKVGQGSTFTVYIPRQEKKVPATAESCDVPEGNGEHILVVDDEEMLAYLGKEVLSSLGYKATMCTSGKDGLAMFMKDPSAFDAVITDQTMPDITGIQLAEHIKSIRPELPVIICTGFSDVLNEEKAIQMKIAAFLNKPIRREIIARTLRVILDKKINTSD